jgi:hypothetical protein
MKQVILIICLIVSSVSGAYGCQPVIQRHSKYFRKAKAVFIGTPVEISSNDISQDAEERQYYSFKVKFQIEKNWKGNKSEITVISDNGSGPCDQVRFQIGEKYLVYAFGKNLTVTTYMGNRSWLIDKINDDFRKKEFAELDSFWFRLKANFWLF